MNRDMFWKEVEAIADRFNIATHPYVDRVCGGDATADQLAAFAVEHYEMSVRDSGPYIARGYIALLDIDAEGAALITEAQCVGELYWKGWDAMLEAH